MRKWLLLMMVLGVAGFFTACLSEPVPDPVVRTETFALRSAQAVETGGQARLELVLTADDRLSCRLSNVEVRVDTTRDGTYAEVTAEFYGDRLAYGFARHVVLIVKTEDQRQNWEILKASFYKPRHIEPAL